MKETVDMDILIKSTTGDTKIMQSTRVTSRPTKRIMKWNVQPVQVDYQGKNHRKYLSCVHFNNQQSSRGTTTGGPKVLHALFCS